MPEVLDGLADMTSPNRVYHHLLHMGQRMTGLISSFPKPFLKNCPMGSVSEIPWLLTARRTLAISASDKIIMLHRPLLLPSFRTSAFPKVRDICTSAALTILREHENTTQSNNAILSIWTQSAFCTTATVVLGLALLYRQTTSAAQHEEFRKMLQNTSSILERRRCDSMATKCANLIHALIVADAAANAEVGDGDSTEARRKVADKLIQDQSLLSLVISGANSRAVSNTDVFPSAWPLDGQGLTPFDDNLVFDFDTWYNQLFTN